MRISEGLQLRVKDLILITARSSEGKGSAIGPDVTESLAPSLRGAAACTGMVAEGPGRGRSGVALPGRP